MQRVEDLTSETVRCDVCGQNRPPRLIREHRHKTRMGSTVAEEVVKYCGDKAECRSAAPHVSFVKRPTPATATRRRVQPGEDPSA